MDMTIMINKIRHTHRHHCDFIYIKLHLENKAEIICFLVYCLAGVITLWKLVTTRMGIWVGEFCHSSNILFLHLVGDMNVYIL